jgi:two-component system OmpR family sensor kinase
MDGRRPRRPRSLKIQLSLWIAAAILAAGCAATAASFYFAFGEAHTFQDDTLRQIGILIGKIPDASIEQAGITQDADPSTEAVAIMRMKDDDTGTCNLSGDIAIPCELSNGWHTIDAGKQRWRLLVTSRPSGLRFAIIQSTALRDEIARDGSLRTLIPMLCLMLALIPLVTLLIQRMLSPVTRLAATLDQARDDDFGEMPETGVPAVCHVDQPTAASIDRCHVATASLCGRRGPRVTVALDGADSAGSKPRPGCNESGPA